MKLIKAFQQTFGKIYGVLVFAAFLYFIVVGIFWSYESFKGGQFNIVALIFTLVFIALMYFRHRLATLIVGIIGLFFSIISFLGVIASYNKYKATIAAADQHIGIIITFSVLNLVMFFLLIFSYLRAFIQNPD
ncbi:MAG: hypothetical protein JSS96_00135 [Bacteroidetes bacterium]|nr:hypothetical protein [Bacteroidota bacterium]